MGGPGYKFADEFHPSLKHSKAGKLSMATPGGNERQPIFITVAATPAGQPPHHFWRVVEGRTCGQNLNVPRFERPPENARIHHELRIERVA